MPEKKKFKRIRRRINQLKLDRGRNVPPESKIRLNWLLTFEGAKLDGWNKVTFNKEFTLWKLADEGYWYWIPAHTNPQVKLPAQIWTKAEALRLLNSLGYSIPRKEVPESKQDWPTLEERIANGDEDLF